MTGIILNNISDCWVGNNQAKEIWCSNTKIWPTHDYNQDYLTITSLTDKNSIGWKTNDQNYTKTISVSTDDGATWVDKTSSTEGTELAVLDHGEKLLVKGNNTRYCLIDSINIFTSTNNFDISGNLMSLVYGDNFINQHILQEEDTFNHIFFNSKCISAQNLVLPATTLTEGCYDSMFYNCTDLTTAPILLPATTLTEGCYGVMFGRCTNLITTPVLPATTLADWCYEGMFLECTNLTTPPELPATTLANNCYYTMFYGCTSLTTVELPATTLVQECYSHMFYNCTALNSIKCLATDISAANCLTDWVKNVSSTGTFVKDANTTIPTGINGIPEGWVIQNI